MIYDRQHGPRLMDHLGSVREPFLFLISFDCSRWLVCRLNDSGDVKYGFHEQSPVDETSSFHWEVSPPSFEQYHQAFDQVSSGLNRGETYLTNLTFRSKLHTDLTLSKIYEIANAPYKVHLPGEFTCFSPESFVQIKDNLISSFPMKGTISASIPNAKNVILNDQKEMAEHSTIVDLIRNDLSRVAKGVHVKRWRYIDHIQTAEDTLLQVSSEIQGRLDSGWQDQIGRLFTLMLPAGSISGAPKRRTLEIIQEAEEVDRGWYTGVCGIFDGERLDSGVMIRLVAQDGPELYYHSGGGITAMSRVQSEFDEMIKKIYVPLHRNHPSQERHVSSSAFA